MQIRILVTNGTSILQIKSSTGELQGYLKKKVEKYPHKKFKEFLEECFEEDKNAKAIKVY
ncbi:MAG: hypothetical protein AB1297_03155 [bacterium]